MTPARLQNAHVELIVIGGSSGAMQGVNTLLHGLQIDVPIAIVLHIAETQSGVLPTLFRQRCAMQIVEAHDKQAIRPGTVYFAPAGYHLLVESTKEFALSVGPRVCNCRPSVDVLFQSASAAYTDRLAAIVLSGANADGATGVASVAGAHGFVLVQDPTDAEAKQMPSAALSSAPVDFVGSVPQIRQTLEQMGRRHGRPAVAEHTRS